MAKQLPERACILYDQATGEVRHVHYSIAEPTAKLPSEATIEKRAFELAGRLRGLARDGPGSYMSMGGA